MAIDVPMDAFVGYTILTMEKLGYSKEEILKVADELYNQAENVNPEVAAAAYYSV